MSISEYLTLIKNNLEPIVAICTYPKENKEHRKNGLNNGLQKLLKN